MKHSLICLVLVIVSIFCFWFALSRTLHPPLQIVVKQQVPKARAAASVGERDRFSTCWRWRWYQHYAKFGDKFA